MKPLPILLCFVFATALPAQRTWIVDDLGGPGVDFTSVLDAIDSAQPRDTILVRPGSGAAYAFPFVIDKPLTIQGIGSAPVPCSRGMEILDLPAEETFVLDNFYSPNWGEQAVVWITNCAGSVFINGFSHDPGQFLMIRIRDSASVHFAQSTFLPRIWAVLIDDSDVTFNNCHLEAGITWDFWGINEGGAIHANDSKVTLVDTFAKGGDGYTIPFPPQRVRGQAALYLRGTTPSAELHGDTALVPGAQSSFPELSVVSTTARAVVIDPRSQATISDFAKTTRELTWVIANSPTLRGRPLSITVTGPTDSAVALFTSLPARRTPLDTPFGSIVVDPTNHLFLGGSGVGTARDWSTSIPIPAAIPPALSLEWQATSLDSQGAWQIGPPTVTVFR